MSNGHRTLGAAIAHFKRVYDLTNAASGDDVQARSEWTKYLVVLASGLIEETVRCALGDFALRTSSIQAARYVGSALSRMTNLGPDQLIALVNAPEPSWKGRLEDFLDDNLRTLALSSIVGNRHKIAHGNSHVSSVTIVGVRGWADKVIEVVRFRESLCSPGD